MTFNSNQPIMPSIMALTKENMETTDERFDPGAMFKDIARMNELQLEAYVRKIFTGQRDDSLPRQFFGFYFSTTSYGSSPDGRTPPSPASFLAEVHDIVGFVARGTYHVDGPAPDFKYRRRFRRVITRLLDECLVMEGVPAEETRLLARFAVEATGGMMSPDDFVDYGEMINEHRTGLKNPPPLEYPEILKKDLDEFRVTRPKMLKRAQAIIDGGRFGQLSLRY